MNLRTYQKGTDFAVPFFTAICFLFLVYLELDQRLQCVEGNG